jgi:hypothetical protein
MALRSLPVHQMLAAFFRGTGGIRIKTNKALNISKPLYADL